MKIPLILLVFLFSQGSCQKHNSESGKLYKTRSSIQDTIVESKTDLRFDISKDEQIAIQGIWAENEEENAWYWIKNDSVYFAEHLDNPVPYKFEMDTLYIFFEGYIAKDRVIQLTMDSLWIEGDAPTDTIKLYKRR
jgi:hypothetical protein